VIGTSLFVASVSSISMAVWEQLLCTGISLIMCLVGLFHLWRCRAAMKKRLFWIQLTLLTSVDFAYCFLHGGFQVMWILNVVPHTSSMCHAFWWSADSLSFLSVIIEVHIAAGFFAACSQSRKLSIFLWRGLVLSVPLAFLCAWLVEKGQTYPAEDACFAKHRVWKAWGNCVISFVSTSVTLYVAAIAKTSRQPVAMRQRANLQGFSYVFNFAITYGVRAVYTLLPHPSDAFNEISLNLVLLNGAINVGTYVGWVLRTRRLYTEAVQSKNMHTIEQSIIDRYFNLELLDDDISQDAQRTTALAVAALQQHMLQVSRLEASASKLVGP